MADRYDVGKSNRTILGADGVSVPFPLGLMHFQRVYFVKDTADPSGNQDIVVASDIDGLVFQPIYMIVVLKDRGAAGGFFAGSYGIGNARTNPGPTILRDLCIATDSLTPSTSFFELLGRIRSGAAGWDLEFNYPDPEPAGIVRLTWTKAGAGRSVDCDLIIYGTR